MNWITELENINYLAVAAATIASYALGFIWYHWAVFGQAWAGVLGLTKEAADSTEGLGGALLISLVSGLLKAIFMTLLMSVMAIVGILSGALFGAMIGVVFIVTSLGYYNGFARMPTQLTVINAAHGVVELTLIGAIIGSFT